MRASTFLGVVSTFLISVLSSPVENRLPSVKLLERAFGPQETWPRVRAIDVLPAGTLDYRGLPIDETHVFSYGPWEVDKRATEILERNLDEHYGKRSTVDISSSPSRSLKRDDNTLPPLTKRASYFQRECFYTGNWVDQKSLAWGAHSSGGDGQNFCQVSWSQWSANTGLRSFAASKAWYFNEDTGQWTQFVTTNSGGHVLVYYELTQFADWNDPTWCAALFDDLINNCKGSNPDSAGGQWRQLDGDGCTIPGPGGARICPAPGPWFTANFLGKIQPYDQTY